MRLAVASVRFAVLPVVGTVAGVQLPETDQLPPVVLLDHVCAMAEGARHAAKLRMAADVERRRFFFTVVMKGWDMACDESVGQKERKGSDSLLSQLSWMARKRRAHDAFTPQSLRSHTRRQTHLAVKPTPPPHCRQPRHSPHRAGRAPPPQVQVAAGRHQFLLPCVATIREPSLRSWPEAIARDGGQQEDCR